MPGIWLVEGQYKVAIAMPPGVQLPAYLVQVTPAHTIEAPLDVIAAMPVSEPPAAIPYFQTLTLAQYEALPSYAPGTVYLILEEPL